MGPAEKIKEIEAEMARTQKNKATEHHLGGLKAKIAKYQRQIIEEASVSTSGDGFDVPKSGVARVVMIGFPSVGKSSLLTAYTKAKSEVAEYQFTTLTCIPGLLEMHGCKVQLLDLPGIIDGAATGKGNGKQVIAVARTADLILLLLDASEADIQREILSKELGRMGIRLNSAPPRISITPRETGGLVFNATVPLTHIDAVIAGQILKNFRMFNVDVLVHEDVTVDEFIDAIEGNRVYIRALYVHNKIDMVSMSAVDHYARIPYSVVVSIQRNLGLEYLKERIWEELDVVRIYTKPRGERPDLGDPIFYKGGCKVRDVCISVHRTLLQKFSYALVWGQSVKHQGQRVGIDHELCDEDVVQIITLK